MKKLCLTVLLLCLFAWPGLAADLTGAEILEKMDQAWQVTSSSIQMTMTIVNEGGQKRERALEIFTKGRNVLVRFTAPSDVKGTGLLLLQNKNETDMWLYLPTLGTARKVASHMQNGSFMGTDFTYQDFSMFGGETYQDTYQSVQVSGGTYDGVACYILDTTPAKKGSDYSRIRIWVDKGSFIPLKMEFIDKKGKLLKVMTNTQVKEIGKHLVPTRMEMENLQQKTRTILVLVKVEYDPKIPDSTFTVRNLEKK